MSSRAFIRATAAAICIGLSAVVVHAQIRSYTIDFDRIGHGLEAFGRLTPVTFFVTPDDLPGGPLLQVTIKQQDGGEADYRILNPNDPEGYQFPDNDFQGNYLQQRAGRQNIGFVILFGETVDSAEFSFGVHADESIPPEQRFLRYTTTLGGDVSDATLARTRTPGPNGNSSGHEGILRRLDSIEGGPDVIPPQPTGVSVGIDNIHVIVSPEPGTWAGLVAGLVALGCAARKRGRKPIR